MKKIYTLKQKLKLAVAFDKSQQTIERWIKNGNDILTSAKAIKILKTK